MTTGKKQQFSFPNIGEGKQYQKEDRKMPYKSLEELPETVRKKLPKHAQEIYRKAYNNALGQYKDPKDRRGPESLEEVAHKVAWSAVEQEYTKNKKGEWVKKEGVNA